MNTKAKDNVVRYLSRIVRSLNMQKPLSDAEVTYLYHRLLKAYEGDEAVVGRYIRRHGISTKRFKSLLKPYKLKRRYKKPVSLVTKDNSIWGHNGCSTSQSFSKVRVPSLKRSKKVWKAFYSLYPYLKGLTEYKGIKLKQLD